jgi:GR25 family glycosyltransferase involved in LPS biosynthesis
MHAVHIYVCHHGPLRERKERLNQACLEENIHLDWVEAYAPSEITDTYHQSVVNSGLEFDPDVRGVQQNHYTLHPKAGKVITLPEFSLFLKHKLCFQHAYSAGYDNFIILEDDVMLPRNSKQYFELCLEEFTANKPTLDIAVLGTAFGFRPQCVQASRLLHYGKNQLTRCSHAILYSRGATEKILPHLDIINWPIDFKLNEIIVKESLAVAWAEPGLEQASQLGLARSSIQPNLARDSFWRRWFAVLVDRCSA